MESLVDNDIHFIERFLNAFKTLGGNEFGFIDYEHFKQVLKHVSNNTFLKQKLLTIQEFNL